MSNPGGQSSLQKVYLTPKGWQEAEAELNFLVNKKRDEVSDRIEKAREFGDTEENSEYDAALDEQMLVENRISYLEEVLNNAKIINQEVSDGFVRMGSTVRVEMDGEVNEFTIVGKMEANPAEKMISNESPLGKALLGTKMGQEVDVVTTATHYQCKILEIK